MSLFSLISLRLLLSAATQIRIRRGALWWQGRLQQAKPFSPASILKFGPEIKNQCTQQGINRQNLASILKFGPEIMNRCTKQSIFSTHPQHASSAHPPARVQARILPWVFCMGTGSTVTPQRFDSGGKAGADAPGGGISLCFCRRGCAAPAKKPPRSTPCRSEKDRRHEIIRRHEKTRPDAAFIIRGTRTGKNI